MYKPPAIANGKYGSFGLIIKITLRKLIDKICNESRKAHDQSTPGDAL